MLRANVVDRRISRQIPFRLPQGTVGETVSLNMDEDWNGLDKIMLVWSNTGTGTSVETELTGTESVVPAEILSQPGNLYLSVVGYVFGDDGELERRITTAKMPTPWGVDACGDLEGTPVQESGADITAALLAAAQAASAAVTELQAQAEAGAFNGARGAPGEGFFPAVQEAGYTGTREEFLEALVALTAPAPQAEGQAQDEPAADMPEA